MLRQILCRADLTLVFRLILAGTSENVRANVFPGGGGSLPLGLRGNMAGFLLWARLVRLKYTGRWEMSWRGHQAGSGETELTIKKGNQHRCTEWLSVSSKVFFVVVVSFKNIHGWFQNWFLEVLNA